MSDKQQSAVEYLHSEYKRIFGDNFVNPQQVMEIADALAEANKLFEQQIIDATMEFMNTDGIPNEKELAEQYFNETFKTESNGK